MTLVRADSGEAWARFCAAGMVKHPSNASWRRDEGFSPEEDSAERSWLLDYSNERQLLREQWRTLAPISRTQLSRQKAPSTGGNFFGERFIEDEVASPSSLGHAAASLARHRTPSLPVEIPSRTQSLEDQALYGGVAQSSSAGVMDHEEEDWHSSPRGVEEEDDDAFHAIFDEAAVVPPAEDADAAAQRGRRDLHLDDAANDANGRDADDEHLEDDVIVARRSAADDADEVIVDAATRTSPPRRDAGPSSRLGGAPRMPDFPGSSKNADATASSTSWFALQSGRGPTNLPRAAGKRGLFASAVAAATCCTADRTGERS